MKRIFLSLLALSLTAVVTAQQAVHIDTYRPRQSTVIDLTTNHFIKDYEAPTLRSSGAVSFIPLGSSYNIYTILLDEQNQVAYNADIDAVAFVHRQNDGTPGGSGGLAFDRSLDGGATWNDNYIVTPDYNAGTATNATGNRYPSITIWNPTGNTDPNNAYSVMTGPALNSTTTYQWGLTMAHSAKLGDGSNVSENYVSVTPAFTDFHPYGLTTDNNGNIWSISTFYAEGLTDYDFYYINKGTFNTTTNEVDWNLADFTIDPDYFLDPMDGSNVAGYGWNIAFGPDGNTGYAVFLGSENSCVYQGIQPIVYKTTDGGGAWTRQSDFDFRTLAAFQDYLVPTGAGDQIPFFTSIDIVVDEDDRLHMFNSVIPRSSSSNDSLYFIWVGAGTEGMFHLTNSTGSDWTCSLIDSVLTEDGAVGAIAHPTRTSMARTEDGSKVFFAWSGSDAEIIGTNDLPNLLIKGYDVASGDYTFTRVPTAGTAVDGTIFFPTTAEKVIETGSTFEYELATVFTVPRADDASPTDHFFIRGAGFNDAEFGLLAPPATSDFSFAVTDAVAAFTNLSFDATEYIWDFGDGSALSGLTNPSHTYAAVGTYNVCLTAKNDGSPATDDETCKDVDITVVNGINDPVLDAAVNLFPSPTSGLVNVSVNGNFGELNVSVFNMLGEQVLANTVFQTGASGTVQLNLNNAPSGNYLVKITGEQGITTRTVVVSH